jgi:hypothetical protein
VWLRPIVIGKASSLDWFVAEGETDAARLYGLVGNRCAILVLPAGANTFKPEWAARIPRGASVVLCHDADEDGDAGAQKAARIIGGRTLRLRPPVEGGDWCDWDGDGQAFLELARAAHDRRNGGPPESLLIDMRAALNDATHPLPHRVGPLALDGFLTLLVGRRGDNKTWLGMFVCNAVHNNIAIPPFSVRQGPALLVDVESGARLLGRRFLALGLQHDAFAVADGRELRLPGDTGHLHALVESTGARLVVIDSLRRMAPGMREDKSDDTAPVMAALANLARDTDAAVVALHHRSTKPNAPDVRGSSALEDQADAVFVLERRRGDPERHSRRRLRCTKMRPDVEPTPLWLSFKVVGGFMTMREAEPFTGGVSDGEDEDARAAHEVMADRLRLLAALVRADDGWSPKRLADALGRTPTDGTFQRARNLLLESGEWEQIGTTRNRRLRPVDSSQSSLPLGNGGNGWNQDASNDPPGNAIYGPEEDT